MAINCGLFSGSNDPGMRSRNQWSLTTIVIVPGGYLILGTARFWVDEINLQRELTRSRVDRNLKTLIFSRHSRHRHHRCHEFIGG
jgi:hypothetical protein